MRGEAGGEDQGSESGDGESVNPEFATLWTKKRLSHTLKRMNSACFLPVEEFRVSDTMVNNFFRIMFAFFVEGIIDFFNILIFAIVGVPF